MLEDNKTKLDAVCQRFNSIKWHDSKLLNVHITHPEGDDASHVYFEMKMIANSQPGSYDWRSATLIMKDCTIVKVDIDLATKVICSNDIAGAHCLKDSSLKAIIERYELKHEERPLAGYLHFLIELIPPAGTIDIFARDFELIYADSTS